MTIFLAPNPTIPAAALLAREAGRLLAGMGAALIVAEECRGFDFGLPDIRYLPIEQACPAADVVVSFGGDGTMLHAARHTIHCGTPLLGVNTGRLGFLTSVEGHELDKLCRLMTGAYTVEHRSVLDASGTGSTGDAACFALNDVVLYKELPEKAISLDIYCDDILVSRFRGDGVIFATATGSTAYSMSAGGPILDARLGGIVVTQICAHIVQTPPMVLAGDRVLTVKPQGTAGERFILTCDGRKGRLLDQRDTVNIRQAALTMPLVQLGEAEQLKSIDKKLKGR